MKIFVTGAAGFIGAKVCAELSLSGHDVVGFDNFNDYYANDLKKLRAISFGSGTSWELIEGDIAVRKSVGDVIRGIRPNCVIHLAGQAGVRIPIEMWSKYTEANLLGFSNVILESAFSGVENFLYASSSSVYGNDSSIPFCESEANLKPTSFYGATKLSNEILARNVSIQSNMRTRGLRFFTVYGPWGRPDMAYFRLVAHALTGEKFTLRGDGQVKRDFTYIDDTARSVIALSKQLDSEPPSFFDLVNIGGGKPAAMNELINIVAKMGESEMALEREDADPQDMSQTIADFSYQNSLIGFKPEVGLEQGVETTFEWARNREIVSELSRWVRSSL
jgi:UDP-glucuronate 4-epimerase